MGADRGGGPSHAAGRVPAAGGLAGRCHTRVRHRCRGQRGGRPVRGGPGRRGRGGHRPAGQPRPGGPGRRAGPCGRRAATAVDAARPARHPGHSPLTEPAAARLGAVTTPGGRAGAVVADMGPGTIDAIGPRAQAVAAGAGELLTAAVAEMLGVPRAAADWVKRGPCVRVDGGQRYEAEDGGRGFLDVPAPASAAGMLAVDGPGGLAAVRPRATARANGGRSGCGSSRPCWRRTSAGRCTRSARTRRRSSWSAARPATRNCSACSPARCPMTWLSAAATSAACPGGPLGHRYAVALGLALAPAPPAP